MKKIKLDENTLRFAINIAWQQEFLCKNTKEGRMKATCYSTIQTILLNYLVSQELHPELEVEINS